MIFKAYDNDIGADIFIGQTKPINLVTASENAQIHQLFTSDHEDAGEAQITF